MLDLHSYYLDGYAIAEGGADPTNESFVPPRDADRDLVTTASRLLGAMDCKAGRPRRGADDLREAVDRMLGRGSVVRED